MLEIQDIEHINKHKSRAAEGFKMSRLGRDVERRDRQTQCESLEILEIVSIINIHCASIETEESKHAQHCELLLSPVELTCVIYSNNC